MAEPASNPIHILMRFSDALGRTEDTIAAHKEIISRHGAVWIGKLGKTLAWRHIGRINEQCARGVPSFLYLVQRKKRQYEAHRGSVVAVARGFPAKEQRLVPAYYEKRGMTRYMSLWLKLSAIVPVEQAEFRNLRIASTWMPVSQTLPHSMAALFIVRQREGTGPGG
jgi:hypothetical protein